MCDECTENAWEMSAEDERERIIKLIETTANDSEHIQHYAEDCWCSGWLSVIELIRGEDHIDWLDEFIPVPRPTEGVTND